jgi:hypothetical protein
MHLIHFNTDDYKTVIAATNCAATSNLPATNSTRNLITVSTNFPTWSTFKGDAEFMTYQPSSLPINIIASTSFVTMYTLATVTEQQAGIVKQVAKQEPPPQAPSRQPVTHVDVPFLSHQDIRNGAGVQGLGAYEHGN